MGADQATLRSRLRQTLRDEDPLAYVWPDEILNRHIQSALAELERVRPRPLIVPRVAPSNPRTSDLTGDVDGWFQFVTARR
jgi:hypothetical protein